MRKTIIAGNWKMNKDHGEGAALATEIVERLKGRELPCEVVILPPFTTLPAVVEILKNSKILAGGQDLYYEDEGAFTGEISGRMLRSLGCRYVLVGHSERRHILGETGGALAKKLRAAIRSDLMPIFCVGEVLEEREAGRASEVVIGQIREVLSDLNGEDMAKVVVAYEPVWAIGTGRTATPADAAEMHGVIRKILGDIFGREIAEKTVILYGGSVKPDNAADLLGEAEIDGVLVGGASLSASSFQGIIFPS
jgi:triosephosphate isomerase